jgi:hypothetical protein
MAILDIGSCYFQVYFDFLLYGYNPGRLDDSADEKVYLNGVSYPDVSVFRVEESERGRSRLLVMFRV